jgi:hypothetical protein
MGRETREIKIVGSVSRHNSEDDLIDDSLFDELEHRIQMIVKERQYERLGVIIV